MDMPMNMEGEKAIQFIHVKKWNSSKIYIFIE